MVNKSSMNMFDILTFFVCLGQATWGGEKTQHNDDYAEEEVHPGMQGGPQCKQM